MNLVKSKGSLKKNLVVSTVNADNGAYIPFSLKNDSYSIEFKVSAVVGSAAMPFIFPPVHMDKFGLPYTLIDGGSSWNNNMVSGIKECFKLPWITTYD